MPTQTALRMTNAEVFMAASAYKGQRDVFVERVMVFTKQDRFYRLAARLLKSFKLTSVGVAVAASMAATALSNSTK